LGQNGIRYALIFIPFVKGPSIRQPQILNDQSEA
jgi:hypothetical protein